MCPKESHFLKQFRHGFSCKRSHITTAQSQQSWSRRRRGNGHNQSSSWRNSDHMFSLSIAIVPTISPSPVTGSLKSTLHPRIVATTDEMWTWCVCLTKRHSLRKERNSQPVSHPPPVPPTLSVWLTVDRITLYLNNWSVGEAETPHH